MYKCSKKKKIDNWITGVEMEKNVWWAYFNQFQNAFIG